jgi:DNA (cytosine-5)-methyltransferase 1
MTGTFKMADLFCGAGGTSTGAMQAAHILGYEPELTAINHWDVAVATHSLNHPGARHLCADLDGVNPRHLFRPGELKLLWGSPECTNHSQARGGMPINDQSRATFWCVVRWAEALRPDVILIENVSEFERWGPLGSNGRPLKRREGETYRAGLNALASLGYAVDCGIFVAADYGDPTTRRRLFIQCVRGRRAITWPNPTHARAGAGGLSPWATARDDVIDWSLQGTSIYGRPRPLAPKTLDRIYAGLQEFGLGQFLVTMEHRGGLRAVDRPMPTITTAKGGAIAVVRPYIVRMHGTSTATSIDAPLGTVEAGPVKHMLAQPYLIHAAHGKTRRPRSIEEPLPTVAGNRGDMALIEAFLVKYYGTAKTRSIREPLDTVTAKDRFGLAQPFIELQDGRYLLDVLFRMLQPSELAAAQGFPVGYQFTGTKTEIVKQIGNAVPVKLTRALVLAALSGRSDVGALLRQEDAA